MKMRELESTIAAADPVDRRALARLDFAAMEANLFVDLVGEPRPVLDPAAAARRAPHARRRMTLALAGIAAAVVLVLVLAPGDGGSPTPAHGAELVRFAEASPLLLLEEPGWRVSDVIEERSGDGQMEFITGPKLPYEHITVKLTKSGEEVVEGMRPPAVRQRHAELHWRNGALKPYLEGMATSADSRTILPVLGTTAQVFRYQDGHPGDYEYEALWKEGDRVLEFRAPVPDLIAFEAHLAALGRVDSDAWLSALPPQVIKAANHGATVREMLKGIPVPAGFDPSRVPDEGLTTDSYQLGAAVTGRVACEWLRQWGRARAAGDSAKADEATAAMATSKHWPILREMEAEGAYPQVLQEVAAAMPSGEWFGRPLLPEADSALGCTGNGVPLE
jgi:hypothetical protein